MQFLPSAFCRVQLAKNVFVPPSTNTKRSLAVHVGRGADLVCQGAVTACEVGLVLLSTAGIALLCSYCGLGSQPKFLELEGKKEFCTMHCKLQIKPLWSS